MAGAVQPPFTGYLKKLVKIHSDICLNNKVYLV